MNAIPFTKVEAIGNNFVLINALDMPDSATADWPALTVRMAEHHFGVGSDGMLVLCPSDKADFRMRMFNSDGSEDGCGNGLRCMAVYIHLKGISNKRELTIEAIDGVRAAEIIRCSDGMCGAKINMGRPSLRPADIPANLSDQSDLSDYPLVIGGETYPVTAVMIGSPHAMICAPLETFWDAMPLVSGAIETHPIFPERVNVTWCSHESSDSLRIRTWERGIGPTLGCGTGACAALVAANLHGLTGTYAKVTSPGGTLEIEWPDRGDVFMSGPARIVYEGEWLL